MYIRRHTHTSIQLMYTDVFKVQFRTSQTISMVPHKCTTFSPEKDGCLLRLVFKREHRKTRKQTGSELSRTDRSFRPESHAGPSSFPTPPTCFALALRARVVFPSVRDIQCLRRCIMLQTLTFLGLHETV